MKLTFPFLFFPSNFSSKMSLNFTSSFIIFLLQLCQCFSKPPSTWGHCGASNLNISVLLYFNLSQSSSFYFLLGFYPLTLSSYPRAKVERTLSIIKCFRQQSSTAYYHCKYCLYLWQDIERGNLGTSILNSCFWLNMLSTNELMSS